VGTVLYLSPEALHGEPSDPSVDLWSTNVMLYECITGRNPFHGSDMDAVVRNILKAQVPDIRSFQPTASGRLAAYFRDALDRDHRRRPKSAKEIRDRLARMAARAA
jgi:serine/threonine-protein kinase